MKTIEIKIPENTQFEKAEVIGGMLVTSFKEVAEFIPNIGDIIHCEYNDEEKTVSWITLVKKVLNFENKDTRIDAHALYMISTNTRKSTPYLEINTSQSADCCVRLATDSEKQLLFSALAKQGKYWDAEALEVKDFLKVPESVGIYKVNVPNREVLDGDGLYISFGTNQLLGFESDSYSVQKKKRYHNKVNCYLQPITYEDIRMGDTILFSYSENSKCELHQYAKVLYPNNGVGVASIANEMCISTNHIKKDSQCTYYKLIPIQ